VAQNLRHFAHVKAIRFDVGVRRSPGRRLVSFAQHNVASKLRTARRDSDTESRPLMAPDFNLCVATLTNTAKLCKIVPPQVQRQRAARNTRDRAGNDFERMKTTLSRVDI